MIRYLETISLGAVILAFMLGLGFDLGLEQTADPVSATDLPTSSGLAWND